MTSIYYTYSMVASNDDAADKMTRKKCLLSFAYPSILIFYKTHKLISNFFNKPTSPLNIPKGP